MGLETLHMNISTGKLNTFRYVCAKLPDESFKVYHKYYSRNNLLRSSSMTPSIITTVSPTGRTLCSPYTPLRLILTPLGLFSAVTFTCCPSLECLPLLRQEVLSLLFRDKVLQPLILCLQLPNLLLQLLGLVVQFLGRLLKCLFALLLLDAKAGRCGRVSAAFVFLCRKARRFILIKSRCRRCNTRGAFCTRGWRSMESGGGCNVKSRAEICLKWSLWIMD